MTAKPNYCPAEMRRIREALSAAQNWVCDPCGNAWWEADAYQCPRCGKSEMHRWGEREDERDEGDAA